MFQQAKNKIKSYLPSRGWAIFFSTVGGISGLIIYDKRKVTSIQRQYKNLASEMANKPAGIRAMKYKWNNVNRKVLVIVEPTSWSPYWFKKYVKPIFDAGAVDYELYEPADHPAEIIEKVRKLIWDSREQHSKNMNNESIKKKIIAHQQWSWFGLVSSGEAPTEKEKEEDLKRLEQELTEKYLPHLYAPLYNHHIGIVALGPNPWRHVLLGLIEGSLTSRENEGDSRQQRSIEHQLDPSIEYPTLGFLSGLDLSGWSNIPFRIYGWVSKRYMCEKLAKDALKIIQNQSIEFDVSRDLALGSDEFRPFEKKDEKEKVEKDRVNELWTEEAEGLSSIDPVIANRLRIYP